MDEERIEEQDVIEDEARDDARADRYDNSEIRGMLETVLERLGELADGMKALFVASPAPAVDEESEEDAESYSLEDLDL